jgi:hypothetical protein
MRKGWYQVAITPDVDRHDAGIYEWRIEGVGVYIGQSKRLLSRLQNYPNNVRKILAGLPWRKGSARDFRVVHHRLREAHDENASVTFTFLENCPIELLNERERFWINRRRAEAESSRLPVLIRTDVPLLVAIDRQASFVMLMARLSQGDRP